MIPSQSILPRKIDAGIPRTVYPSSSIQTILSVLELHQILTWTTAKSCADALADYTADREFHPALKIAVLLSANRLLRKKGVVKRETGKWKKLIKKSQEFAVYSCQKTSNHTKMEGMSSLLRCLCGDGNSRLQRFCSNEKHALRAHNHPMLCSAAGQVSPARRCMSGCGADRKSGPFQRRGKRRRGKRTAAQGSGGGRGRGQVRLWFRKTERESVKRLPHLPCHGMSACSKEHLHCRE